MVVNNVILTPKGSRQCVRFGVVAGEVAGIYVLDKNGNSESSKERCGKAAKDRPLPHIVQFREGGWKKRWSLFGSALVFAVWEVAHWEGGVSLKYTRRSLNQS